jgi:integrase
MDTEKRLLLTTKSVRGLTSDDARGTRYYDSELRGFLITVFPSGRKVFAVRYGPRRRRRYMTIGDWGSRSGQWTEPKARKAADGLLAKAKLGADPALEVRRKRAVPTFAERVEVFVERSKASRAPATVEFYSRVLKVAAARFGNRPLDEVTREDFLSLQQEMADRPVSANALLYATRALYRDAVASKLVTVADDPTVSVEGLRTAGPRTRVLRNGETPKLIEAIKILPDPVWRTVWLMLFATGVRCGELRAARWVDLNLEEAEWFIPKAKTGPRTVALTPELVELLRATPRVSEFIVPNARVGLPLSYDALWLRWRDLLGAAGLPRDLRLHDLRRSFGDRVRKATSLHLASRALGHSSVQTTSRSYAPEDADEQRAAAAAANVLAFPLKQAAGA